MKHTLSLLAVTAALTVSAAGAAWANKQQPTQQPAAKAQTQAQTQAGANANDEGFFGNVKGWFKQNNDQAKQANAQAPAAGETQQPRQKGARINANANAGKRQPSANEPNPTVGRYISETGADMGIRSNARMGQGAGGSVGNE